MNSWREEIIEELNSKIIDKVSIDGVLNFDEPVEITYNSRKIEVVGVRYGAIIVSDDSIGISFEDLDERTLGNIVYFADVQLSEDGKLFSMCSFI